ncbi:MAG: ComEC/Rec2 family competence protein [Gemmobacter sp.]
MAGVAGILLWPFLALQAARGTLFPWAAVAIGAGVGLWFLLPWEPGAMFYVGVALVLAAACALRAFGPELLAPVAVVLACAAAGMLAAGLRVNLQAAPMLDFRYWGPVQGRIVGIDRSSSDAIRLTLDQVVLEDTAPARTPDRVRVSLQGEQPWLTPAPGQVVILTAHLSAPQGPVEPGTFDFRRMAYFDRLGAVGYTRTPVLLWEPPVEGALYIDRLRSRLSAAIQAGIPGDAGAFAAGAMTGDRSGISQATVESLRDSNLAHLLAISGMNMAFLVAFVFALLRTGMAAIPPLALRVNTKKVAAVVAFGVAWFYLLLSGSNVATERAFIMVAVMLGAILLDRRALTLRSVAIAAAILILWQPESLLEPGFQMSFAATVALIAGFRAIDARVTRERLPRWMLPVFTLLLSSVIAGLATAPYAAAHFGRFTDYGLLANLLTVPAMGLLVMPGGAMAALLAPFGLAVPALWLMGLGSWWILFIAGWIAGLEGSVTAIPAPSGWVLPVLTLGALWLVIGTGRARLLGLVPMAAALVLWVLSPRPDLLIDAEGRIVGLMTDRGRALSAPRGGGFAAENWLQNDGDLASQPDAAARPGFAGPKGVRRFVVGGVPGVALSGKAGMAAAPAACAAGGLVVLAGMAEGIGGPCALIDQGLLRQTGSIAVWVRDGGLHLVPARGNARRWQPPPADPAILADLAQRATAGLRLARAVP